MIIGVFYNAFQFFNHIIYTDFLHYQTVETWLIGIIAKFYDILENYQALLWWIFQTGKFLLEKATLI